MRSKITANIDSELLDIAMSCCDSDLDSIIQDSLAQFLGIRQIWVKSDTLEPISKPDNDNNNDNNNVPIKIVVAPEKKINESRFRRKPKYVLNVWDNIEKSIDKVFTPDDYYEAAIKCGINYKESAKRFTILEHLNILEEAGKITIINFNPRKYRKVDIEKDNIQDIEENDDSEQGKGKRKDNKMDIGKDDKNEQTSGECIEPEEKIGEIIDHGKDVQSRERKVEKEMLA